MKKTVSVVLTMILVLELICSVAFADEIPQPEGGKKFESDWAKTNGLVEIHYEEEGYRVSVDLYNQVENVGTLWEYSCYYVEEKDVLESVSSSKIGYAVNPDTLNKSLDEYEYQGLDVDNDTTVFKLSDDGALIWEDGRENMGRDLQFRDIGRFEGVWKNPEEEVYTEFWWKGLYDENTYFYSVYIHRGGDKQFADYSLEGLYNPETGKLEAYGTVTATVLNEDGSYETAEDGEPCEAVFSDLGNGKILYETANGIELEYDILGPES